MGSVGILGIVCDLCDLGGRRFPVSTNLPESSWGPDDHRPRGQMFGGQMYRGPHDRPSSSASVVDSSESSTSPVVSPSFSTKPKLK